MKNYNSTQQLKKGIPVNGGTTKVYKQVQNKNGEGQSKNQDNVETSNRFNGLNANPDADSREEETDNIPEPKDDLVESNKDSFHTGSVEVDVKDLANDSYVEEAHGDTAEFLKQRAKEMFNKNSSAYDCVFKTGASTPETCLVSILGISGV